MFVPVNGNFCEKKMRRPRIAEAPEGSGTQIRLARGRSVVTINARFRRQSGGFSFLIAIILTL